MLGNLRNGPIAADQSERFSQPVSQITHSHFRVSHFADYPSPMGNGVSGDQGNLPANGKRDVREGIGAKRHDWSELARTREIVTSPPIPTSYRNSGNTRVPSRGPGKSDASG